MTKRENLIERERLSNRILGLTAQLNDARNTGAPSNEIRLIAKELRRYKRALSEHEIKYNPQLEMFPNQFS